MSLYQRKLHPLANADTNQAPMSSGIKSIGLGLMLSCISFSVSASEPTMRELLFTSKPNYKIGFENDFFFGSDRNYTNAVRLSVSNNSLTNSGDVKIHADKKGRKYKLSGTAHIANNIYTGRNIKLFPEEIAKDDRPYAGWTYVGIGKQRVYKADDSMRRWEFDLGCIGPCAGSRNIQTFVHDIFDHTKPQGWDSQIGNDAAVQFFYDRHLRRMDFGKVDLSPSAHLELGTIFNSIGIGGTFRLGRFESYFDGIGVPSKFPKMLDRNSQTKRMLAGSPNEKFLYLRVRAKLVAYNATIEGGMFRDNSPSTQDIRHGILDLEAGFSWEFKKCVLSFHVASRSTEIDVQPSDLFNHKWGGVNFIWRR